MSWLSILALAKRFWPVLAGLLVVMALWLWGNHREAQGRDAVLAELRAAEAQAEKESLEAAASATTAQQAAQAEQQAYERVIEQAIEKAEAQNTSPLDALWEAM